MKKLSQNTSLVDAMNIPASDTNVFVPMMNDIKFDVHED